MKFLLFLFFIGLGPLFGAEYPSCHSFSEKTDQEDIESIKEELPPGFEGLAKTFLSVWELRLFKLVYSEEGIIWLNKVIAQFKGIATISNNYLKGVQLTNLSNLSLDELKGILKQVDCLYDVNLDPVQGEKNKFNIQFKHRKFTTLGDEEVMKYGVCIIINKMRAILNEIVPKNLLNLFLLYMKENSEQAYTVMAMTALLVTEEMEIEMEQLLQYSYPGITKKRILNKFLSEMEALGLNLNKFLSKMEALGLNPHS